MKKKKRRLNYQRIFWALSAGFILACCLFYGIRFVCLYLEHKKTTQVEDNTLATIIKNNNKKQEDFIKNNKEFYFKGNTEDNYLMYKNILWRIVKINEDNSIRLVSENNLSNIAYGENIQNFNSSYVYKWLNSDNTKNTGILENAIDSDILTIDKFCLDNVEKTSAKNCEEFNEEVKFGTLSIFDYKDAGADNSYLNNSTNYYLSSSNDNEVWYVNSEGKVNSTEGYDFYGIRPTITLKATVSYEQGNGTKDEPYLISNNDFFGSYVKLGDDLWQVYKVEDDILKLSLNDYLKVDNQKFEYIYSNKNYLHNDTLVGSLAYYLNYNYYNSLPYNNVLISTNWSNGNIELNYDYSNILNNTIDTKITNISVGDIILNNSLSDYFLLTGYNKDMIYTKKSDGTIEAIDITNKAYVVPTIAINKDKLTKGNGTLNEPYEMEVQ